MTEKQRPRAISYDETEDEQYVAPSDQLSFWNIRYYKECEDIRNDWNEWYHHSCIDVNKSFEEMMEFYFHKRKYYPETVIAVSKRELYRKDPKKIMRKNFAKRWFITLTSKPEWTEEEAKQKIDKYREKHFKKYKYIWVEEHGTDNGGYHQHVLVEGDYFHTGQNLKSSPYYDANINVLKCGRNNGIFDYMNKENQIQGDTEYFF